MPPEVMSLDAYTRRARLRPALLITLPVGLAVLAWDPNTTGVWGLLWALIVWSGGAALIAQIGRDLGKKKEPDLFHTWGGKPTTIMLRYRDSPNTAVLARRHKKLQDLLPDLNIPTAQEEEENPQAADEIYEACATFLREKTRDREKFHLLFEENCNYGFRRNLWGMKRFGLTTTILGVLAIAILAKEYLIARGTFPQAIVVICGVGNLLLLAGWIFWFTPTWVKASADAYAERLLASAELL